MDKAKYQQYVKTDCWSLRRQEYLKRHEWCELCGQSKNLQVHHLTYERLGQEEDHDLLAVCEGCHRLLHKLPSATPKVWAFQYVESMADSGKKQLVLQWLGGKA